MGILDNHSSKTPPNRVFSPINFGAGQKKGWCICTGCTGQTGALVHEWVGKYLNVVVIEFLWKRSVQLMQLIRVFMQRTLVYILYKFFLSNSKIKHFLKTINPRAEYWLNKFIPEKYYPCLLACTIPMSCKWDIKHDFIQLMGKKEFRLVYIVVNTCFQEIIGITLLHQTESTQNKSPLFLIPYPRI